MNIEEHLNEKKLIMGAILVLSILAIITFIGLMMPLWIRFTTGAEVGLCPHYFNIRTVLPTAAFVLLMGVYGIYRYFESHNVLIVVGVVVLATVVSVIVSPCIFVGLLAPVLVFALIATSYKIWRAINPKSMKTTLRGISPHLIHLGVVLLLLGTIISTTMVSGTSQVVGVGETVEFQRYAVRVTGINNFFEGTPVMGYPGSVLVSQVMIDVYKDGRLIDRGEVRFNSDIPWEKTFSYHYINRMMLHEELFVAARFVYVPAGTVDLYIRTVPGIILVWGGMFVMSGGITILMGVEWSAESTKLKKDIKKKYEKQLQEELKKRRERGA